MEMSVITSKIIYLGIFILIGFFGVIFKYLKPSVSDGVSTVLTKISLPFLVITSFASFDLDIQRLKNGLYVLIASYILIFILLLLGKAFAKLLGLKGSTASAHAYLTACGNVSFVGYPVITAVLGPEGFYYAMFFALANDSVVWTLSVFSLTSNSRKKGNVLLKLFNPNTLALIVGFVIMVLEIKIPTVIFEPMQTLGSCTIPLSMLFIGMTLATINPSKILSMWKSLFIVLIKMLVMPAILIFAFSFLGKTGIFPSVALIATIMQVAVPSGTAYAILAKSYGGDYEYASQCVFITTILSFFTIPFIYFLITKVGVF